MSPIGEWYNSCGYYSGGSRYLTGFYSKLVGGGLGNEGGVGLGNGTTLACDTRGEQTFDWVGVLVVGLRNGTTLDGNTWGGGDI